MKRLTTKIDDIYTCSYCENQQAINRLAEFEDFMEELGLDTVEELRKGYNDNFGFTQALITENQALKDRWNKLYKDIAKFYNDVSNDKRPRCVNDYIFATCEDILYKMRELEKE